MARSALPLLKPRKLPRQARARATVDAIFEATIQVLLAEGASRLTTTRVAERAGVSVGTMYQYFPHKQALLFAVMRQHLEAVAEAITTTCARCQGMKLAVISDELVATYLEAKTRHLDVSRALYAVAAEFDTDDLVGEIGRRSQTAVKALLQSACDVSLADAGAVAFALRTMLAGTIRSVLERSATPSMLAMLRSELPVMCRAYVIASASPARRRRR